MALILPREILYMILGLLRDDRDYASIYRCAISSKYLAGEALTILYQYGIIWKPFIYSSSANAWWYTDCMIPRRWQAVAEQKTSRSKLDGQGAQWPVPNASRKRRFGNGRLCGVRLSCLRWIRPIFRITAISGNWILMIYPNYWAIAGLKGRLKSKDTCLVYSGVFSSDRLQWFLHAGAL